ncbi:MAG: stress response translation initiation inhibitor YciH [Candidatus Altiarchaeota archaeon]
MICPKCGLPKELCVCEEMTREGQRIRVRRDRRKYGKYVTIVDGFEGVDIEKVAKELKSKLACGGTVKDGKVELQGDHLDKTKKILVTLGFSESMID